MSVLTVPAPVPPRESDDHPLVLALSIFAPGALRAPAAPDHQEPRPGADPAPHLTPPGPHRT
ncbi:hypothetical protein [Streptomyces lincolnensis]|uniref:hypothetical protein n=1 Tax=Streptomyces lincolnensis TaxID=1915 RepID=UPI00082FCC7D|nr:hypothetical protein [Streptomyces lincolnensis]QMV10699.1 hypothetical protein GJU35_36870 [Streptomyces lincolnensis]